MLETQSSALTAAPTVVLVVVSAVTLPLMTSSATRLDDGAQSVPVEKLVVNVVCRELCQCTVIDDGGLAVVWIVPLPPVVPVQIFGWMVCTALIVPITVVHLIPIGG